MKLRALLPLLLVTLAACSAPTPPAADTTAPTSTAVAPASADEPAGTTAPASTTATAPNASADAAADKALAAAPGGLEPGRDFVEIKDAQPWMPLNGKIEVVEVFGYVCPACAAFNPLVEAWKAKLPSDVRFSYVPAPFGPEWNPYAKAFYVADSMGLVDRSHDALIRAIHVEQSMPGEGDPVDEQAIANFYGKYGANPKEFLSTMNSFTVAAQVNRGKQFMQRTNAASTPTLIVNGKYRVTGTSFEDMLRIASALIAQERARMAGGAPAAAATTAAQG
jgi:thiol:disulfide interchange protein DsbA